MLKIFWLALCLSPDALAQARLEYPVWSPDGTRIAFAMSFTGGGTDWNVYVAKIDGTGLRQLTRTDAWDAAWSPDSATIALVSTIDGKRQISVVYVDGSNVRQLTQGDTEGFHPAWSPKGAQLAFTCRAGSESRICIMNTDGFDVRAVTPANQQCRWPAWSPDGKRVAYWRQGEVWATNLGTGEQVRLFAPGPGTSTIDWSPDGRQILFAPATGEQAGIQVFDISSGETRRILGADWRAGEPRWSPDGRRILFAAGNSKPGIYCFDMSNSTVREIVTAAKMRN